MTFDTLVILSFAAVPFIEFSGYIPKLIEARDHEGPIKNFSYRMWVIWLISGLISLAYGVFHLQDLLFTVCVMFNLAPVCAILGYALYKEDNRKLLRVATRFIDIKNSYVLGFFGVNFAPIPIKTNPTRR